MWKLSRNIFQLTLFLWFAFQAAQSVEYYAEKPEFLKNSSCKLYEPHFTKCATKTMQKLIDELAIVIPEVGSFDPMKVRDINYKQDDSGMATIGANLKDIVVTGFSKTKILMSKANKKDMSWVTKTLLPKMHMDANYQMSGKILLLPLNGAGKMFIEIENLESWLHIKVQLYDRGGFTFYNVTNVRADINMTRIRSHFDNLFNGSSKELEESTNQFFNENWRDFYEAIKPIILQTVENINYDIMHKVFNLIPANFFVEDTPTAAKFYGNATSLK